MGDQIVIERATLAEMDLLIAIHEDAARWLWARGIHQRKPGTFPRDRLVGCIERGEVYLVRLSGWLSGMVILQESDELTWPKAPHEALYIHGLRVLHAFAGQGLGRAILDWAEGQAAARRKAYLRLDVMADNPKIRAYYESAGVIHVRNVYDMPWHGSLYEKRVEATQAE